MRPANSFIHVPDCWQQAGITRSTKNRFEFVTLYSNGKETLSETELLSKGIACYRVQIDKFTVRDYSGKTEGAQ